MEALSAYAQADESSDSDGAASTAAVHVKRRRVGVQTAPSVSTKPCPPEQERTTAPRGLQVTPVPSQGTAVVAVPTYGAREDAGHAFHPSLSAAPYSVDASAFDREFSRAASERSDVPVHHSKSRKERRAPDQATTSRHAESTREASQRNGARNSANNHSVPSSEPSRKTPSSRPVFAPHAKLHLPDTADYQGRTWIDPPSSSRTFAQMEEYTAYVPKRVIQSYPKAHEGGASVLSFFPEYGHLLFSGGLDGNVRVWDVASHRKCIQTYCGHQKGVRDICIANDGRSFLSAGYDRCTRLWDTETGRVVGSYTFDGAIPFCVKFHPDDAHQNEFLAGCSDKKVIQMDIREAGKVQQSYDQHIGAVNSIAFVDDNRRFVSSADDKVLRVWEYGIPVVIKYISDPTMHSMPVLSVHPNRKWMSCQSMDNTIYVYSTQDRFKMNTKRSFSGHLVAGFACGLAYSPDGRFLASGDSLGRAFFWDWKTARMLRAHTAHKGVCTDVKWHPTMTSRVATCSRDGDIKLWD